MANKIRYKGYSSVEFDANRTFAITNVQVVKTDILNHIFTRRGERPMMPTYGTQIPDLVFEQLDDELVETVRDEILEVVRFEPRVTLRNIEVIPLPDSHFLAVHLDLTFVELNTFNHTIDFNIIFG